MHWNNRNMMNRVVQPGKADVLFEYDAFNRRASQQNENGTTRYVYDGQNLVLELNEQNQPVSYFSYGANGLIGKEDLSANKTIYYLYDGLGNVVNTTDEAGRILQTYEYEAFGRVRNISFDPHNDFRSLGAYGLLQDDATDFRYNRARYYDAEIGRFISRDPIGIAGGINLYGYSRNNPVNRLDISGLCEEPEEPTDPKDPDWTDWFKNMFDAFASAAAKIGAALAGVGGGIAGALGLPSTIGQAGGACAGGNAALQDRARRERESLGDATDFWKNPPSYIKPFPTPTPHF
jgi:RHS repeat-associated protein